MSIGTDKGLERVTHKLSTTFKRFVYILKSRVLNDRRLK